jgi:hypothetical protein
MRMNHRNLAAFAALMLGYASLAAANPAVAVAQAQIPIVAAATASSTTTTTTTGESGSSLEAAASKAGDMGRKIALSLIGLGLAVAAIRLCFRRNFKEATAVVVLGLLAVLLASPTGESLLQNTVSAVFGS